MVIEAFPGQGGIPCDPANPEVDLLQRSLDNHNSLVRILREKLGIDFKGVFGNSAGLYAALAATGVLTAAAAVYLIKRRTEIVKETEANSPYKTGMVSAVGFDEPTLRKIVGSYNNGIDLRNSWLPKYGQIPHLEISNDNGITLKGIGGPDEYLERLVEEYGKNRMRRLDVKGAYHHSSRAQDAKLHSRDFTEVEWKNPHKLIISSTNPRVLVSLEDAQEEMSEQMTRPVELPKVAQIMESLGFNTLIDSGPGNIIQKLFQRLTRLPILSLEQERDKIGDKLVESEKVAS